MKRRPRGDLIPSLGTGDSQLLRARAEKGHGAEGTQVVTRRCLLHTEQWRRHTARGQRSPGDILRKRASCHIPFMVPVVPCGQGTRAEGMVERVGKADVVEEWPCPPVTAFLEARQFLDSKSLRFSLLPTSVFLKSRYLSVRNQGRGRSARSSNPPETQSHCSDMEGYGRLRPKASPLCLVAELGFREQLQRRLSLLVCS